MTAKKKRVGMADIEIDAGVVVIPGLPVEPAAPATTPSGAKRGRPANPEKTEPFQLHLPPDKATEIRVEAAKRKTSHSAILLEAWEMWKANPPESY